MDWKPSCILLQRTQKIHSKANSSKLSSVKDVVFQEKSTTDNFIIWMRCVKYRQTSLWQPGCQCSLNRSRCEIALTALPICDNHLSAKESDVSQIGRQTVPSLSSARCHKHMDVSGPNWLNFLQILKCSVHALHLLQLFLCWTLDNKMNKLWSILLNGSCPGAVHYVLFSVDVLLVW